MDFPDLNAGAGHHDAGHSRVPFVASARLREHYHQLIRRNLHELDDPDLSKAEMTDVAAKIWTQVSDQPGSLLAYGMAILELMRERS